MRILSLDYPSKEDMKAILKDIVIGTLMKSQSEFIKSMLKSKPQIAENLAIFLLELFSFVQDAFTSSSQHHYHFTPKNINSILENLLAYEIDSPEDLGICLAEECKIVFRNRLVGADEISKYDNIQRKLIQKYLRVNMGAKDFEFSSLVKKTESFSKVQKSDYIQLLEKGILSYERENIELNLCLTQ